jgi:hypothetical protein
MTGQKPDWTKIHAVADYIREWLIWLVLIVGAICILYWLLKIGGRLIRTSPHDWNSAIACCVARSPLPLRHGDYSALRGHGVA